MSLPRDKKLLLPRCVVRHMWPWESFFFSGKGSGSWDHTMQPHGLLVLLQIRNGKKTGGLKTYPAPLRACLFLMDVTMYYRWINVCMG